MFVFSLSSKCSFYTLDTSKSFVRYSGSADIFCEPVTYLFILVTMTSKRAEVLHSDEVQLISFSFMVIFSLKNRSEGYKYFVLRFLLKFFSFSIFTSFLCIVWAFAELEIHCSPHGYPVVSPLFVEKTLLSPIELCWHFLLRTNWPYVLT